MKLRPIVSSAAFLAFMLLTLYVVTPGEGVAAYQEEKGDKKAAPKAESPAPAKKGAVAEASPPAAKKAGKRGQPPPREGAGATTTGEDVDDAGAATAGQTAGQQSDGAQPAANQNANAAAKSQPANAAAPADNPEQGGDWVDTMLYWGIRALGVLGVLLVLGLIGYGVKTLVDASR